eukprot:NODE_4883_length_727_cov_487.351667_g4720_i0.p1 GENE.NODE_4883_length_727_cov_487.351667_g4720_i0~~NODE_4883_length_727_cov_487.351667_g4720_i0.p1  ORF type:complete len:193 (+),score=11.28 NODE_4883_length_727_cov_487.351667_g4720_i0:74-652(+)
MITPTNSAVRDTALEELADKIASVEQQILIVGDQLEKANPEHAEWIQFLRHEKQQLRTKEQQLRTKEEQLRKKEEQLRTKEEQLREEKLILLRKEVNKTNPRLSAACSGGLSSSSSPCSTPSSSHSPPTSISRTSHLARRFWELLFTVSTATPKDSRQQPSSGCWATRRPSCDGYLDGADAEKQPFIHHKTS